MNATILPFTSDIPPPTPPIAHYLRIGLTGHRKLETLQGEGRLLARRFVVDASRLAFQKELIGTLKTEGAEIVLDTNAAELSVLSRFDGLVRTAPWAAAGEGKPLQPEHFAPNAPSDVIGHIARYAVEHDVDAVLAPGHFLPLGVRDEWFEVDRLAKSA